MSSLYPSLEDMKVDHMIQAQHGAAAAAAAAQQQHQQHQQPPPLYPTAAQQPSAPPTAAASFYPDLGDFMGLELSEQMLAANMPDFVRHYQAPSTAMSSAATQAVAATGGGHLIAPLSGASVALHKAQVTNGIRQLVLCKDAGGKIGLRCKAINKGCFVSIVVKDSPAATVGLRFGDQLLEVDGKLVAGYTTEKVHDLLKRAPKDGIRLVVRDRPFERTVTLHRDSKGQLGVQMDGSGKVTAIVKDSSAARNGMLTEHHVLEIDARNVVGMTEKERLAVLKAAGQVVTFTVVPSFIYEHMVQK